MVPQRTSAPGRDCLAHCVRAEEAAADIVEERAAPNRWTSQRVVLRTRAVTTGPPASTASEDGGCDGGWDARSGGACDVSQGRRLREESATPGGRVSRRVSALFCTSKRHSRSNLGCTQPLPRIGRLRGITNSLRLMGMVRRTGLLGMLERELFDCR